MDPVRQSHAQTPEQFGPYEVYERLGMGGMASVHRAKKRGPAGFERTVALKRMLSHLTEDRNFVDSFVREAKVASMLVHHNIAQTYDFGRINGVFYIAMELVGGYDLRKLLRHAHRTNEPIPLPVVLSILAELCEALDYAHAFVDEHGNHLNIVHRDISPSNMIISPMGHVKVIDFGIAKANSRQLHTETGSVKGKLGYMAPEVALGMAVGSVSDIFSAGVVAWELVTALPLFSSRTDFETMRRLREEPVTPPSRHNPTCPALLDQVILAALAREPEQRLTSARAFRTVLDQVANQQGLQINARVVAEWMKEFGPPGEMIRPSTAVDNARLSGGLALPLPATPETRVTRRSKPITMGRSSQGRQSEPVKLRRSDEDIALATEIWGEDATKSSSDEPGEDFSMMGGAELGHGSDYVQSLPGTPIGAQIPSLLSGRAAVIAPSQPGFHMPTASHQVQAAPQKSFRMPILILGGLAVIAGILGGLLYAKKSEPTAAPASTNAEVLFVVEPEGSTVIVAGRDLGSASPLETELAPGVYSITVKHDGYKPWTSSITLRDGDKQTINVALQTEPIAMVQTPPAAPVTPPDAAVVQTDPVITDKQPDKPGKPDKPDRIKRPKQHTTTSHAVVTPPKEVDPPKVDPPKADPVKVEPPKIDPPPKTDPPKIDPPKVTPPPVDTKPKTTPLVGPAAVTKLSGEVPTLRGKSGDSSDILAKMCIDEAGRVANVTIKKSAPEIAADLQRALMTWKYKPYVNKDSKVQAVCFPLSIRVILKQ